jgi:hypothetical protein
MRRFCWVFAGAALVLTAAAVGCGGDSTPAPGSGFLNDTSTFEFKSTDVSQFASMTDAMKKNMQSGAYTKRPTPSAKEKRETKPAQK